MLSAPRISLIFGLWCSGCGADAASSAEGQPAGPPGEPAGEPSAEGLGVAQLLGGEEVLAGDVELFTVFEPTGSATTREFYPTALAWNPVMPDELWITLRKPLTTNVCTHDDATGCDGLRGRVAIVYGATGAPAEPSTSEMKEDANAWHFMRRPTSIAFGTDGTFATCAEALTSNYEDDPIPFNGPALWSADPAIFGVEPPKGSPTGSTHIDMLHDSPYCMGLAHERDNVYWAFNGDAGAIDRYDFHEPHAPGLDDHSDGELHRYAEGTLERVVDVPSHLAYDAASAELFVADSGHGRIVALDTTSGAPGAEVTTYDPIVTHVSMSGVRLRNVVASGRLGVPSGLALHRGVLFVTDALTSRISAFDTAGHTLATFETGLPTGALAGIAIGPDDRAYFADRSTGRVFRIDAPVAR